MKTAQQAAANWSGSAGRAATSYQQGVESYNGDWAGATVAQQAVLVANFNQAVNSGLWSQGVQAKGTAGWKADTVAKLANYSTGFTAGRARQAAAKATINQAEQTLVPSRHHTGGFGRTTNTP